METVIEEQTEVFPLIVTLSKQDPMFQATHIMIFAIGMCCEVFGIRGFQSGMEFSGSLVILGTLSVATSMTVASMAVLRSQSFMHIGAVAYGAAATTILVLSLSLGIGLLVHPIGTFAKTILAMTFVLLELCLVAFGGLQIWHTVQDPENCGTYFDHEYAQREFTKSLESTTKHHHHAYGSIIHSTTESHAVWLDCEKEKDNFSPELIPCDVRVFKGDEVQQQPHQFRSLKSTSYKSSTQQEQPEDENLVRQQYQHLYAKYQLVDL